MDLLYMSETFNYYSARGPIYDRYENAWDKAPKEPLKPRPAQGHTSKANCQLCRDNKKRSLSKYIRTKSIESSMKGAIPEEEAEEINHNQS